MAFQRVSFSGLEVSSPPTPTPCPRPRHPHHGEPVTTTGVPLYTDARHYAAAGIPVLLYGAGPRDIEAANAHRANERVPLADLHRATEIVALTLADYLSQ